MVPKSNEKTISTSKPLVAEKVASPIVVIKKMPVAIKKKTVVRPRGVKFSKKLSLNNKKILSEKRLMWDRSGPPTLINYLYSIIYDCYSIIH